MKDPIDGVPSVSISGFVLGSNVANPGGEIIRMDDVDAVEVNGERGGGAGRSRMSTPGGSVMLRFD
jgi:hypothetical protein